MCGIAGIISQNKSQVSNEVLLQMGKCLAHRGPDGHAVWLSDDDSAGFSHTRLSVIDKSAAAAQPMHYGERFTIIYNGEIYNYIELKEALIKKGYQFKTSSDTEVILASYMQYKERCVEQFDGMFAFALWDDENKTLFCARDRFGEKPFFYSTSNGFYFASEIKALHVAGMSRERDNGMLLLFLGTGGTIDPADTSRTFYRKIKKLPASHWLMYDVKDSSVIIKKYWDVSKVIRPICVKDALEELNALVTLSVKRRIRSDVPIGTSLSGGLDSSTIAAWLAGLAINNLKTFTASFPGFEKDETAKAQKVAAKFHFQHFTIEPGAEGLIMDFEKMAWYHDEPIASGSVYAQYKVFELAAKEHVTVLLDGQGADELFAGYDHYRRWKLRSVFPAFTARLLERRERRHLSDPSVNIEFAEAAAKEITIVKPEVRDLNHLLYFDTFCSGLEQLLRYADRNAMAHGREVRLPFLCHELAAFIFSLPARMKIHEGYTKWLLRRMMADQLPHEIVWTKRKTGFEPPQKMWMEHPVVQDYMIDARKKLVDERVLSKVVLDQRLPPNAAYDRKGNGWRWMSASAFIHKKGV
ncbi:MAG TPA: asparagine synthase (glutamine-hydrolyzing) [Flavitalea sp.]|nr:asparagine synthase (glutamine-hydrolyzing) [Flavitalea sp.]